MQRLTQTVHEILAARLAPGSSAVDATAGKGHDTLALARLVGPEGRVYAYDLQAAALEQTRERLVAAGAFLQCQLHQQDHAEGLAALLEQRCGGIDAVVFNLGYLPGGDKSLVSSADRTLPALDAAALLLRPEGILLVTAYRGHPGGPEEADAVAEWMELRRAAGWRVEKQAPEATGGRLPPVLWIARQP